MNRSRNVFTRRSISQSDGDADWPLNTLEDACRHVGLIPFWRTVDDPDLIGGPPKVITHSGKSGSIQKSSHGDERDHAIFSRMTLEDFPGTSHELV